MVGELPHTDTQLQVIIMLLMNNNLFNNCILSGLAMVTTAPALVNQYVQHVMPSCMPQGAYQPNLPLQITSLTGVQSEISLILRLFCVYPVHFPNV